MCPGGWYHRGCYTRGEPPVPTDDPNRTAQRPEPDPGRAGPAPDAANHFDNPGRRPLPVPSGIPDDAPNPGPCRHVDRRMLRGGRREPAPDRDHRAVADRGRPAATQVPVWAEVVDRASRSGVEVSPSVRPTVPGYVIEKELGRGAMGVVYKAHQTALKRTVALKMLLYGMHADPVTQARFEIEAEAVAAVRHRHIVEVHDFGRAGGCPISPWSLSAAGRLPSGFAGMARLLRGQRRRWLRNWRPEWQRSTPVESSIAT